MSSESPSRPDAFYERRVHTFESVMDAFYGHSTRVLAELKRQRNSAISNIHGLPNEVLLDVFLRTRDEGDVHYDPSLLHTLGRVCKRWHDFVLSSPQLWSRISSRYDAKTLRLFLRRSRTAPLTVVLCPGDQPQFFSSTSPSSFRWRAVVWRGSFSTHTVDLLRHLPPTVEELDMSPPSAISSRVVTIDFQGTIPFKHVTLRGARFDWTSPRLSSLSTLTLADVALDWASARPIIASSPGLEVLCLRGIKWPADGSRRPLDHRLIDLPNLTKLVMRSVYTFLGSSFVRTLSIPSVQLLFIDYVSGDVLSDPDAHLLHSLVHMMKGVPSIILSARMKMMAHDAVTIGTVPPEDAEEWIRGPHAAGFHIGFNGDQGESLPSLLSGGSALVASSASLSPTILEFGSRVANPYGFLQGHGSKKHGPLVVPPNVLLNLSMTSKIRIGWEFDAQALVDALASQAEGHQLCPQLECLEHSQHVDMTNYLAQRGGETTELGWRK